MSTQISGKVSHFLSTKTWLISFLFFSSPLELLPSCMRMRGPSIFLEVPATSSLIRSRGASRRVIEEAQIIEEAQAWVASGVLRYTEVRQHEARGSMHLLHLTNTIHADRRVIVFLKQLKKLIQVGGFLITFLFFIIYFNSS